MRRQYSAERLGQLVAKYEREKDKISKVDFCKREQISSGSFYRQLQKQRGSSAAPKFIELERRRESEAKYKVSLRILGIKVASLEVQHV